MKNKLINKKDFKLSSQKCRICGIADYDVLDVHRIKEGSNGGRYVRNNTVCLCSNCHRKIHTGNIKILGWRLSTSGEDLLMIKDQDGNEMFI